MSFDYVCLSGSSLVWSCGDTTTARSIYRIDENGSYTEIGTSSSSSFSILPYSGIHMKYAVSTETGYSNVVECCLPISSDLSGIDGSKYVAAALESTMTGEDIKTILHTHRDAFTSPVFTVAVSDTTKLVDTFTEAYDPTLPVTVVLCKDGSAIDILASHIQDGELIYFAGAPGANLTYNILDDVSDPSDSTTRVSYYPDSELVVQNIPGSMTVDVKIDTDSQGVTIAGVNYRLNASGVMIPFGPNGLRVSLVGIGSWVSMTANSCTFTVSGSAAYLTGLNSSTGTLTIPASFTVSGATYNVMGITGSLTNAAFVSNLIFDASSTFTTIPASAFTGCTNLSSITLPPGITTIGDNAFDGLTNFRTITNFSAIPLTSIGFRAFRNCSRLTGTLPSTITHVGADAFYVCSLSGGLVCPTLSLRSLGVAAFRDCGISGSLDVSGLTAIPDQAFYNDLATSNIHNLYNTQNLTYIGYMAFLNCHRLVASFTSSITDISARAFERCGSPNYIPSATMTGLLTFAPMTLRSLGVQVFADCANLSGSIDFSNSSITSIPLNFFLNCPNLTSVTMSPSMNSIDYSAFNGCSNLTTITNLSSIPLTTVGASAFQTCRNLTASFPSSITDISASAFQNCQGGPGVLTFAPMNLRSFGSKAFYTTAGFVSNLSGSFICLSGSTFTSITDQFLSTDNSMYSNIDSITLPDSVTTIGFGAFNCYIQERNGSNPNYYSSPPVATRLTSVSLGKHITTLSGNVFYYCSALQSVTFPSGSSLTTIGDGALRACPLLSFSIPPTVTTIGTAAFAYASNISGIISIPSPLYLTSIGPGTAQTFAACAGLSGSLDLSACTNLTTIFINLFTGSCRRNVVSIRLPVTVTSIGHSAFLGCSMLESVWIDPSSQITSVDEQAFMACHSLVNLTFPPTLITIGTRAFSQCPRLRTTFPSSIRDISSEAFRSCNGPGSISFSPMNLRSLGSLAFFDCITVSGSFDLSRNSTLTTIQPGTFGAATFHSITIPPSITSLSVSGVFNILPRLTTLFLDVSNVSYLNVSAISCPSFNTIVFLNTSTITTIPTTFNSVMANIQYLTLPDSVTTIAASAFVYHTSLISVTLSPTSQLATIGDNAFNGCTNLTTITNLSSIPLTSIGYRAFTNCHRLVASFPSSITDISADAFWLCGSPNFVPSATMTGLLTFAPMSLRSIGSNAFNTCANLSGTFDFSNSSITTLPIGLFGIAINLTSVRISSAITTIQDGNSNNFSAVFGMCSSLSTIFFYPNSQLTYVGFNAFTNCTKLTGTLPSTITDISGLAFNACSINGGLVCPTLSLRSLGGSAFSYCGISGSFDISGLTTIPSFAFRAAGNLQHIYNAQNLTHIGDSAFDGCVNLKTCTNLSASQTTYIGYQAFRACRNLTTSFPSSITDISAEAFQSCSNGSGALVFAPMNLRSFGSLAFGTHTDNGHSLSGSFVCLSGSSFTTITDQFGWSRFPYLRSITFPDSLTLIEFPVYTLIAPALTSVTFGKHITRIGAGTFHRCPVLQTVTFPTDCILRTIGTSAFQDCTLLSSIFLPSTLTDISNNAFLNCSGSLIIGFAGLPPVLTASGSLNTTRAMFGVYPSALESQWLPTISGGLFRNLRMRSSQLSIAMTTAVPSLYNSSSILFSLSGTPNTTYSIYDASALCISGNMTSATMSVTVQGILDGSHSFYAILSDVFGNVASTTPIRITTDTIAPICVLTGAPTGYTQQRTVTIGISGEIGTFYRVYRNGSLDASGTLAADTVYTLSGLTDASYSVYATLTDLAGNLSLPSASVVWIVDTIAPAAPVLSGAPMGYTQQKTATIGISGEIGTFYRILFDGSLNSYGTMTLSGITISFIDLSDGEHTLSVTLTDYAGNVSSSSVASWTVDTIAPYMPVLRGAPSVYSKVNSGSISISGDAGTVFTVLQNGIFNVSGVMTASGGSFAYTNLSDGVVSFSVYLTDSAGNQGNSASASWIVDTIAPYMPVLTSTSTGTTTQTSCTIYISGEAGTLYTASLNSVFNVSGLMTASGASISLSDLSDGTNTVRVYLTDAAGNNGNPASVSWIVDTILPNAPILSGMPSGYIQTRSGTISISGEVDAVYIVTLNSSLYTTGMVTASGASFSYSDLSDGVVSFSVWFVDATGNVGAATTVSWTIDTVPPVLTTTSPGTSDVSSISFTISGNATYTYNLYMDGALNTSGIMVAGTTTVLIFVADGSHNFYATFVDPAGMETSPSNSITIVVDTLVGRPIWNLASDGTWTVVGYSPPTAIYLVIDASYSGAIAAQAFQNCTKFRSVSMPSITTIGVSAFQGCTDLTSVSMPSIIHIYDQAFQGCSSLTTVSFPASLRMLGSNALRLTGITNLDLSGIPLTLLGRCTEMPNLISATLPGTCALDEFQLAYSSSLESAVFQEGITNLPHSTFQLCTNLSYVSLPQSLTALGHAAFVYSGLKTITIPPNVSVMAPQCFSCDIQTIYFECAPPLDVSSILGEYLYGEQFIQLLNVPATVYYPSYYAADWVTYIDNWKAYGNVHTDTSFVQYTPSWYVGASFPVAPINLTVVSSTVLQWTAQFDVTYDISAYGVLLGKSIRFDQTTTTCTLTFPLAMIGYVSVTAKNPQGSASSYVLYVPAAILSVVHTRIEWAPVAGATQYTVYSASGTLLSTQSSTTFVASGNPGETASYYVTVDASQNGISRTSVASNRVNVIFPIGVSLTLDISDPTYLTLQWSAQTGVMYSIYMNGAFAGRTSTSSYSIAYSAIESTIKEFYVMGSDGTITNYVSYVPPPIISRTDVYLSWIPVVDDDGGSIQYNLYSYPDLSPVATNITSPYMVVGSPGMTVEFVVTSVASRVSVESAFSSPVSTYFPTAPTNVSLDVSSNVLSWDPQGDVSVDIFVEGSLYATVNAPSSSYSLPALSTISELYVVARNGGIPSTQSSSVFYVPAPVATLSATTMTWTHVGADSYTVYSIADLSTPLQVSSTTSYTISGHPGDNVAFVVVASTTAGARSANSNTASTYFPLPPPNVVLTQTAGYIQLTWDAQTNVSYMFYMNGVPKTYVVSTDSVHSSMILSTDASDVLVPSGRTDIYLIASYKGLVSAPSSTIPYVSCPQNLLFDSSTSQVSWDSFSPSDTIQYKIYASSVNSGYVLIHTGTSPSYTLTGTPGTSKTFVVTAYDEETTMESAYSAAMTVVFPFLSSNGPYDSAYLGTIMQETSDISFVKTILRTYPTSFSSNVLILSGADILPFVDSYAPGFSDADLSGLSIHIVLCASGETAELSSMPTSDTGIYFPAAPGSTMTFTFQVGRDEPVPPSAVITCVNSTHMIVDGTSITLGDTFTFGGVSFIYMGSGSIFGIPARTTTPVLTLSGNTLLLGAVPEPGATYIVLAKGVDQVEFIADRSDIPTTPWAIPNSYTELTQFAIVAKGATYVESSYSNIVTYVPAPSALSITGTSLSWSGPANVFCTVYGAGSNSLETGLTQTTIDIASYNTESSFYVVANDQVTGAISLPSAPVAYAPVPSGLSLSGTQLSWIGPSSLTYSILVSGSVVATTTGTTFDISSVINPTSTSVCSIQSVNTYTSAESSSITYVPPTTDLSLNGYQLTWSNVATDVVFHILNTDLSGIQTTSADVSSITDITSLSVVATAIAQSDASSIPSVSILYIPRPVDVSLNGTTLSWSWSGSSSVSFNLYATDFTGAFSLASTVSGLAIDVSARLVDSVSFFLTTRTADNLESAPSLQLDSVLPPSVRTVSGTDLLWSYTNVDVSFQIYSVVGGVYTQIAALDSSAHSYSTGQAPDTAATYAIAVVRAGVQSAYGVYPEIITPAVPSGLNAVDSYISWSITTVASITFNIYRANVNGSYTNIGTTTDTSFSIVAYSGIEMKYVVTAVSSTNTESAYSNLISYTVPFTSDISGVDGSAFVAAALEGETTGENLKEILRTYQESFTSPVFTVPVSDTSKLVDIATAAYDSTIPIMVILCKDGSSIDISASSITSDGNVYFSGVSGSILTYNIIDDLGETNDGSEYVYTRGLTLQKISGNQTVTVRIDDDLLGVTIAGVNYRFDPSNSTIIPFGPNGMTVCLVGVGSWVAQNANSFTFDISGNTARITGLNNPNKKTLNIPATITYRVGNVTRTVSVVSVGNGVNALLGASNVRRIVFDPSATFTSIAPFAFSSCAKLRSIELPSSLTTIGNDAFRGCPLLNYMTFTSSHITTYSPDSDNDDDRNACEERAEANIYYRKARRNFRKLMFKRLRRLQSGYIETGSDSDSDDDNPNDTYRGLFNAPVQNSSLTTIGENAFRDCVKLELTDVNDCLQLSTIGGNAFYNCVNLFATFPSSIKCISGGAFSVSGETGDGQILFNPMNLSYLGENAFSGCLSLSGSIDLSNSDLSNNPFDKKFSICPGTFHGCSNLQSIKISNRIRSIDASGFSDCVNLTSVTLYSNSTLESIGQQAFSNCRKLSAVFPSSITSIGGSAFLNCSGTGVLTFSPMSLTVFGSNAFSGCTNLSGSFDMSNSTITSITNQFGANGSCTNLRSITFSRSLTTIGESACMGCTRLSTAIFPSNSSITTIGVSAFQNCPTMTATFPSSITSIGASAFLDCSGTGILIFSPMSLTGFGSNAFSGCANLSGSFDMSNSTILSITNQFGANGTCTNLRSITFSRHLTTIGASACTGCSRLSTVTIPSNSSITAIGDNAFKDCSALTTANFSNCSGLVSIGLRSFFACNNLTTIFPSSITSIGASAFQSCSGSGVLLFSPMSLTTFGNFAFRWCTNLSGSFDMSNSTITSITNQFGSDGTANGTGNGSCTNLRSVILPSSLTRIGAYAFVDCSRLSTVTIPTNSTLQTIGIKALANIPISSLSLPSSVNDISNDAFHLNSSTATIFFKGLPPVLTASGSLNTANAMNGVYDSSYESSWLPWIVDGKFRNLIMRPSQMSISLATTALTPSIYRYDATTQVYYDSSSTIALTLSGTPNTTYTIYNGENVLQTGLFAASPMNLRILSMPDASYSVYATLTDSVGTVVQSSTLAITVMATPPAAPIIDTDNSSRTYNSSTVDTIAISISGELNTSYTLNELTSSQTFTGRMNAPAPPRRALNGFRTRAYTYNATLTNSAGLTSLASPTLMITVDITPPNQPDFTTISPPITSLSSIPFTISGEQFSTYTVYMDGSTNSAIVGSGQMTDAVMNITISGVLDGSHTFYTTLTDGAGNVSVDSVSILIQVLTTPPNTPVLITTSPSLTNISYIPFTISGSHSLLFDMSYILFVDDVSVASGPMTSSSISFTLPDVLDGSRTFYAKLLDSVGNLSQSSNLITIVVDTTAPPPPDLITSSPSPTNISSIILTISGEADASYSFYIDDAQIPSVGKLSALGKATVYARNLSDGSHTFYAILTDAIGNISQPSSTTTIVVDTITPDAPILITASPLYPLCMSSTSITFTISGEADTRYSLFVDHSLVPDVSGDMLPVGTATISNLTQGIHTFKARLTDNAGNTSIYSSITTVFVDSIVPDAPVLATTTQSPTNISSIPFTISGEARTTYNLFVNGVLTLSGFMVSTPMTVTVPDLSNGSYDFTATLTDDAGNVSQSSETITIVVDIVAPDAPILETTSLPVTDISSITFTISGDLHTTYNFFVNGVLTLSGNMDSSPMTVTVENLLDGVYDFSATLTDAVGNVSQSSEIITIVVDTVSPAAPFLDTSSLPITDISSITFTISGEIWTIYHLFVNGLLTLSGNMESSPMTVIVPDLSDGSYHFSAILLDAVGNVSQPSNMINIVVDTVNPLPPTCTPIPSLATETITISGEIGTIYSIVLDNGLEVSGTMIEGGIQFSYANLYYTTTHTLTATLTDAAGNQSQPTTVTWTPPFTLTVSGNMLAWNGPSGAVYYVYRVNTDSTHTLIGTSTTDPSYDISLYVGLTITYRVKDESGSHESNDVTTTLSITDYPPTNQTIPPLEYITAGVQSITDPSNLKQLLDNKGAWFTTRTVSLFVSVEGGIDYSRLLGATSFSTKYPSSYYAYKEFTVMFLTNDLPAPTFVVSDFPTDSNTILYFALPKYEDVSFSINSNTTQGQSFVLQEDDGGLLVSVDGGTTINRYGLDSVFSLGSIVYTVGAFGCVACVPFVVYTPTNVVMNGTVISWLGSESDTDISYGVYNVSGHALVGITSNLFLDVSATVYPLATYYVVGIANGGVLSAPSTTVSYVPPPINLSASGTVLTWDYPANAAGLTFTLYSVSGDMYTYETSLTAKQFDTAILNKANGTYIYVVTACYNFTESSYSNTVSVTISNGGGGGGDGDGGLDPRVVVPCFLADAPVLTPTGYTKISELSVGDEVLTADGRIVRIQQMLRKLVATGPSTNPYTIPKGLFGATRNLSISPNHRVVMSDGSMVEARFLGLRQSSHVGVIEYYNLELPDWKHDNMVVAGVAVESLAPVRRMTMTIGEFKKALLKKYGDITPAIMAKITNTCRMLPNGRVDCPVLPV